MEVGASSQSLKRQWHGGINRRDISFIISNNVGGVNFIITNQIAIPLALMLRIAAQSVLRVQSRGREFDEISGWQSVTGSFLTRCRNLFSPLFERMNQVAKNKKLSPNVFAKRNSQRRKSKNWCRNPADKPLAESVVSA